MRFKVQIALLAVALIALPLWSQDRWRMISDSRDVREVIHIDGQIWCATSGGLAALDIETGEFTKYTMIDGLADVGISSMAVDSSGGLWLAFENSSLQRFMPGVGVTHTAMGFDSDDSPNSIRDIEINSRGVFLATDRGIARVTYSPSSDRWVWLEEYIKLGDFPTDQGVNDIELNDSDLWAATDVGIAVGDLTSPLPRTWVNYTTANGLQSDLVQALEIINGAVIAATDDGLSEFNGSDSWIDHSSKTDVSLLSVQRDSLYAVRERGLYVWTSGRWEARSPVRWRISSVTFDGEGEIWCGQVFEGYAAYRGGVLHAADGVWEEFVPSGPISNHPLDLTFAPNGDLLLVGGVSGGQYGLSRSDGANWEVWSRPEYTSRIFSRQNTSVIFDLDGNAWVGSWGGGIAMFSPDSVRGYDYTEETGRRLIGYSGNPNYVLAPDLALDGFGNIWVVNRGAENGEILVRIPREFIQDPELDIDWNYFHRSLFRGYPHFDHIAIDGLNRKWIAASTSEIIDGMGVYAFDEGDIDDPADDRVWGPFPGLGSPQVLSMAWDDDGYIWVGTIDGAYYVNANVANLDGQSFTELYPMRDSQVNVIAIDPTGNKWFGGPFGVFVVADDLFTIKRRITSERPDLAPSSYINALAIDPFSGWAYIGTDRGTVALFTPYRDYGEEILEISIEPNPFNPLLGRMIFTGSSLANMGEARFYTPDGRLVRRLDNQAAAMGWDGFNDNGDRVASGVYLIVTHSDDGKAARGKVAVIWK